MRASGRRPDPLLSRPRQNPESPPPPGNPHMILELADITIAPGRQADFDAAIQRGIATVVSRSPGFLGCQVHKGIESPERYILTIRWATLENHTVDFRGGPLFTQWREIVGPFFAKPPVVEHFDLLASVN